MYHKTKTMTSTGKLKLSNAKKATGLERLISPSCVPQLK
jgi:hypothetical protein